MTAQDNKLAGLVDLMEDTPNVKSSADKDLRELQSLRQALAKTETGRLRQSFDQRLHDKIMAEIATATPESRWKVLLLRPQILGPVAAAILGVVTVGLLNLQTVKSERPLAAIEQSTVILEETPINQMILSEASKDPAAAAKAMNATDSEQEFLMDALSTQLEGLSGEQVDSVFESLMEE